MWCSVHAFLYYKFKDGNQDEYFGYETIYLIEAATLDEARKKGRARAKEDEGDSDGTLTSNGRPPTLAFAGILKLVECEDLDLETEKPINGTELSYSDLTLPNERGFENFIAGCTATVIYHGVNEDADSDE